MTAVELLSHPLAQRLTWTLAHFVWQGLLIAVVLALVVELLRPRSVHVRYALSLAALVVMLAAVPVTWWAIGDSATVDIESVAATKLAIVAPDNVVLETPIETASSATSLWLFAQPILFCAWLLGCLLLSARLLVGWIATQALLRSRVELPADVAASLSRVGYRLRTSISQVVFASEQVSQALAVGFFRPVVLLPTAWLLELPPNLLEAVVAHELAHLRRCDLWVNFLQRVAEALLFYHPAIWWLSARLRRERELCCDQLAVSATGERLCYAEALEITARWAAVDGRPALAAGFFGEGKMNLLHRVRCVLGLSHERPATLWPASLLFGGLSLALLAAIYVAGANAQEERPKPKDGERREGEVRRDGDRPRPDAAPRDGDRPRDGEARRDGDRPRPDAAPRDGDRRPDAAPRDGERRPGDVRPDGRSGFRADPNRLMEAREGGRPAVGGGENAEMMAIIRQLRAEVAELRAEVARLRGSGTTGIRGGGAELRLDPRREGDRPRPDAERPREGLDRPRPDAERPREGSDRRPEAGRREGGDRPGADRPGADRPRAEGERREGERREGGDRPKAEGERK